MHAPDDHGRASRESATWIRSLPDPRFDRLCQRLEEAGVELERDGAGDGGWPAEQLRWLGEAGVFAWFLPEEVGGLGWDDGQLARAYVRLGAACLTTTFILTQRVGACRRLADSPVELRDRWLPPLITGERFATVGISHLTTSRRHLARPVLTARKVEGGYELNGFSPWVTGSTRADLIVIAATLEDSTPEGGGELLAAVPTDAPGVEVLPAERLMALTASQTGRVNLDRVFVSEVHVVAGPAPDVMGQGRGAATGGLQTSALAVGLAEAAIRFTEEEAIRRSNLLAPSEQLRRDWQALADDLYAIAEGPDVGDRGALRGRANSLALRAAQAALLAAKGTGYVHGHPAGRWCREALFFLVWSCPQPVSDANLCELAGIEGDVER